jgi:hypothetical protein
MRHLRMFEMFDLPGTRLTLSEAPGRYARKGQATYVMSDAGEPVGEVVLRESTALADWGYPRVRVAGVRIYPGHSGKGYFQEAMVELLRKDGTPLFMPRGEWFRELSRLDSDTLDLVDVPGHGYVVSSRRKQA